MEGSILNLRDSDFLETLLGDLGRVRSLERHELTDLLFKIISLFVSFKTVTQFSYSSERAINFVNFTTNFIRLLQSLIDSGFLRVELIEIGIDYPKIIKIKVCEASGTTPRLNIWGHYDVVGHAQNNAFTANRIGEYRLCKGSM